MNVEKRVIRQARRAERKRLPAPFVEAAGVAVYAQLRALPFHRAAVSLGVYWADEHEIPTEALIGDALSTGCKLYLPRDAAMPAWVRWHPDTPLRDARGGVKEPLDGVPTDLELPALVLLPVVAWDLSGTRLGRGGGFYDRLLAGIDPCVVRVGLAYEFQEFPELPRDPWDVSMHYVITERRVVVCGDGREASVQKGGLQP